MLIPFIEKKSEPIIIVLAGLPGGVDEIQVHFKTFKSINHANFVSGAMLL